MNKLPRVNPTTLVDKSSGGGSSIMSYFPTNSSPITSADFPTSITIIGGGCSGSLVAAQLLRQARGPFVVHLIERSPQLCRGVAYSTQEKCHLLNVPAGNMSAFPDEPNHFLNWAQRNEHLTKKMLPTGVQAETFVPRKLYGTYLQSVLANAEAIASVGVRLEHHRDEVVAIEFHPDGATVHLQSHQVLRTQNIVLALGNFPSSHPPVETPDFYNNSRYIGSVWSVDALLQLSTEEPILLIGSSLTMVDLAIALHEQGHQGTIHVVSRHGLVPHRHTVTDSCPPFSTKIEPQPLRSLVRQVREQVRVRAAQGQDWRTVVDSLRPITQELWQALSLKEQRQFMCHVRPYWDIHRHRLAPNVADGIDEMLHNGQLVVHAGRIQAYQEDSHGVEVKVRKRHAPEGRTDSTTTLRVSRVVNCTGPASNYGKLQHPLVANLRSQGLLCPDDLAQGIKTAPNGALLNAQGVASKHLYTLGPTRKGELGESVAVPEIRVQAMDLAQELLSQLEVEANYSEQMVAWV